MQYNTYCAYSSTRDNKLKAQPYREIRHPQESFPNMSPEHVIAIFDDPPPHKHKMFHDTMNYMYCNGRHKGYSPIVCCQDVSFLTKDRMGFVKQNTNLFIFPTKETSHMIKDLSKNNIIDSEVAADLHTYPYDFMYNVVDKRRGRVYLLDRRGMKTSESYRH